VIWLDTLVQGILLGGLYALFAAGLSLVFGIMRLVNIAHGDFIVLSAYVALVVTQGTGLDPISSLIIVVPVMFVVGYAIQRGLLNHTLSGGLLPPLLVTFGISVIIQNGLLAGFGAYTQRLHEGAIETASVQIPGGISDQVAVGLISIRGRTGEAVNNRVSLRLGVLRKN